MSLGGTVRFGCAVFFGRLNRIKMIYCENRQ